MTWLKSLFFSRAAIERPHDDLDSFFLFSRPSFWGGFGNAINPWGKSYDLMRFASPEEADVRALYADWRVIGQDLRDAFLQETETIDRRKYR